MSRRNVSLASIAIGIGLCTAGCAADVGTEWSPEEGSAAETSSELVGSCNAFSIEADAPRSARGFLDRAWDWVRRGVPYCQCVSGAGGPYRTDCSGFVSYVWGLGAPGPTTYALAGGPWDAHVSHVIGWDELTTGDALNFPGNLSRHTGHVMLFAGWLDAAHTQLCAIEESRRGTPAHIAQHSVNDAGSGWGGSGRFRDIFLPIRLDGYTPSGGGAAQQSDDVGVAVTNADGRLEIFARAADDAWLHEWQTAPGGAWSGWAPIGGAGGFPAVARNADGRVELFVTSVFGPLRSSQTAPGAGLAPWQALGGNVASISAAESADGRLEAFGVGPYGLVFHKWQATPGGAWSDWAVIGTKSFARVPVAARDAEGRLEAFAVGPYGLVFHASQTAPGGGWTDWTTLGAHSVFADLSVVADEAGSLQLFGRGPDGAVWQADAAGHWSSLGGFVVSGPAAARNSDGRLEVFARGLDGALHHDYQTAGGAWSGWSSLGGQIQGNPFAGTAADGALVVFAKGTDGALWHLWQTDAGSSASYSGWASLGGPVR